MTEIEWVTCVHPLMRRVDLIDKCGFAGIGKSSKAAFLRGDTNQFPR